MTAIVPPLDLTNPKQIRAYMARRGLLFNQLQAYEDPECGLVDPLEDDDVRREVRLFIGRIWQAALRAERSDDGDSQQGPGEADDAGNPITCEEFVDNGRTRTCARCGWWRTSHSGSEGTR